MIDITKEMSLSIENLHKDLRFYLSGDQILIEGNERLLAWISADVGIELIGALANAVASTNDSIYITEPSDKCVSCRDS